MVYSAAQLVRERGVADTGVRDVISRARAPRGSFQHYFPGGKEQLIGEALAWSAEFAVAWTWRYLEEAEAPTPSGLFAHLTAFWQKDFAHRDFERGCPLQAAGAQLAGGDGATSDALRAALARWSGAVAAVLIRIGVPAGQADGMATLVLSTLEGAILLSRVRQTDEPLLDVVSRLSPLLDQGLPDRPGPG
jgi:AcrR family transcriptional regulator